MKSILTRVMIGIISAISAISLTGCGKIQIFKHTTKQEFTQYAASELQNDIFYVKDQTRFAPVYLELNANYKVGGKYIPKKIDRSRVIWFNDDEYMIPSHYKGEIIAYKSLSAEPIEEISLERYEDIGYSFGIYGGEIGDDGYYHLDSAKNVIPGSSASQLFRQVKSTEIRIVSINGNAVSDYVDSKSGTIRNLEKDQDYTVVFFAGTQKYQDSIKADIHIMQAYEIYLYGKSSLSDTNFGYLAFNTPETLKSGYYNINGKGLFKYYSYEKGSMEDSLADMNEKYYTSEGEMIRAYSQQYQVSLSQDVRDLEITMYYGEITDDTDMGVNIGCYAESPEEKGYDLILNEDKKTMTLSLTTAKAGNWILSVAPKSLDIKDIQVTYADQYETTTLFEQTYEISEGNNEFKMFYADILGNPDAKVMGSIVDTDGITYDMKLGVVSGKEGEKHRYLYLQMPYLKSGTYKMKIYYYQSENTIDNAQITDYTP